MVEIHVAVLLKGVAPTEDGLSCRLDFERDDGSPAALVFPLDQVELCLSLLLQVERRRVEKSPLSQDAKNVLLPQIVEVALDPQTQNILLDFHVGKMRFAFALPREDAVNLVRIISEKLPSH